MTEAEGGNGSQKRSNGGNVENEENNMVFFSVSFVSSVAPFLRSVASVPSESPVR
jgi:hypothetical protein